VSPYYSESKVNSQDNVVDLKTRAKPSYDVAIVGAGSGGIAAAASILKRNSKLRVAIIDPATEHFYQPGWTMVGGGVFDAATTRRSMQSLIPRGVTWLQQSAVGFAPKDNEIELDNGDRVHYSQLIVAPGLTLDWAGVKGLAESLGKNGVTSNYSYQHAPYTWELVHKTKQGKAIFTQPPMPIKCAGAPQKALYLSCDHWRRAGVLKDIDVNFFNAGGVLFGVPDYVPALQSYIDKYEAKVHYSHNLQEIDGENKVAHFKKAGGEGEDEIISQEFDMIHVCPPQRAPKFVADSELADAGGWLEVDQFSLQHKRFDNVWGLGDVMNTPNAKTMAAVRKQVPVVAQNLVDSLAGRDIHCAYDGYGSCPLTVERGKIVLAEFGYGGKIIPTFPTWMLQGKKPTRRAWALKKDILPGIYWGAMLKGREWLAGSEELEKARA
jgi:sulfide:quinone oxidoreductase